jgi:hypothetical protein
VTTRVTTKANRMQLIPPFAGVTLIEYRDRIELTPFEWVREFVGLGRFDANEVRPKLTRWMGRLYDVAMGNGKIWVVARWQRYEDGRDEALLCHYLDSAATEAEAEKAYERMVKFANLSKEELEALTRCFVAKEEDLAYIENRFPGLSRGAPNPKSRDEWDLYQARLKMLAGQQPRTVELLHRAESTEDPEMRAKIERQTVGSYFAEMAHSWTEDEVKEWQRTNPVGTEWMCEFARVCQEPECEIDPVNHELALNWLRRKYNLLTAEELSDAILIATGQRMMPGTLKKRRERLGLTTKRPPGPRPNPEQ